MGFLTQTALQLSSERNDCMVTVQYVPRHTIKYNSDSGAQAPAFRSLRSGDVVSGHYLQIHLYTKCVHVRVGDFGSRIEKKSKN